MLNIDDHFLQDAKFQNREELIQQLSQIVDSLINQNFERFLSLMYRMDVSEKKLKEILSIEEPQSINRKIAELILLRQEEKIFWREKYNH